MSEKQAKRKQRSKPTERVSLRKIAEDRATLDGCRLSRRLVGDTDDFMAIKVPRVAEYIAASVAAGALFDRYADCEVVYVNVMDDPEAMEVHVIAFLPPWPQSGEDAYVLFKDTEGEPVDVRAG